MAPPCAVSSVPIDACSRGELGPLALPAQPDEPLLGRRANRTPRSSADRWLGRAAAHEQRGVKRGAEEVVGGLLLAGEGGPAELDDSAPIRLRETVTPAIGGLELTEVGEADARGRGRDLGHLERLPVRRGHLGEDLLGARRLEALGLRRGELRELGADTLVRAARRSRPTTARCVVAARRQR